MWPEKLVKVIKTGRCLAGTSMDHEGQLNFDPEFLITHLVLDERYGFYTLLVIFVVVVSSSFLQSTRRQEQLLKHMMCTAALHSPIRGIKTLRKIQHT